MRLRDGAVWSRIRLSDQAHLEPWEPVADVNWQVRHASFVMAVDMFGTARRGAQGSHAAVSRSKLDGQFCGQLTIGNVTHGALRSAWIGYWVAKEHIGGGVATAALALGVDHGFGPVAAAPHRGDGTARERAESRGAGEGALPRGGFAQRYLEVDGAWRDHLLVADHDRGDARLGNVGADPRRPRQLDLSL